MTTAVYFDLDGTLLEYSSPFAELFTRTVPTDASEDMIETYSRNVLAGISQSDERPYEQAFDAVRVEYDLDVDPAALAKKYIETEADATRLSPSVRGLVEAIATQHPTGILTNGDGRMQRRKIETHGLAELVDTVIVSGEVGTRKPDNGIFEIARERLPADTFVYIGDTFEEDIVPAREAGFETVYIGDDDRPDAPVAASDMEELAALLRPLLDD
ncbi:HAD family hydrolase [Natronoarchaeum sp. GCM10025703]|uniref:HAD family hydrolase n=1 Tax=unclassified Natronoarchaeum TaxID=2620183 RepID=UPI0036122B4B